MAQGDRYALLSNQGALLGYGELENTENADMLRIRLPQKNSTVILKYKDIRLKKEAENDGGEPLLFGSIIDCKDGVLYLKRQGGGIDRRQNLRVPVFFDTFIYPKGDDSGWKGRCKVTSNDLSGGGIAFFCDIPLKVGECVEVVIPITPKPLLLLCEILRQATGERGNTLYAGKFINLCGGEEAMVCEAVFSIQIEQSKKQSAD